LDFPFIIAYTSFLIVLVVLTGGSRQLDNASVTLMYFAILAGALDVIENAFMLTFLMYKEISSYTFAVPAMVKFVLISLLAGALIIRLGSKLILRKE
jgi:hypothetical protein